MMPRAALCFTLLSVAATGGAAAQQSNVPTSGNVLATPAPRRSLNPAFAVKPSRADIVEGRALFRSRCASCHGEKLQGSPQAPPLLRADAQDVDFMLQTGRMPAQVPWEQEFDRPPAFARDKIRAIVDYVMTKSSGSKMLPRVRLPGDLQIGRQVYVENCEQCHAATGRGNNVGGRNVAPSLMDSSPEQIAEAVRVGPNVMPEFGPRVIDDASLDDLITYIGWLQRAQYNPGGLQLSNWGPASEGFVAWILGLGVLVLLIRRIGTTD